jgi:hypothetical protein
VLVRDRLARARKSPKQANSRASRGFSPWQIPLPDVELVSKTTVVDRHGWIGIHSDYATTRRDRVFCPRVLKSMLDLAFPQIQHQHLLDHLFLRVSHFVLDLMKVQDELSWRALGIEWPFDRRQASCVFRLGNRVFRTYPEACSIVTQKLKSLGLGT